MGVADDDDARDAGESRPASRWIGAVGAVAFVAIQLALQHLPYTGVTEWSFGVLSGVAGAAAMFWEKHDRRWFWPTVLTIAVIDVILILLQNRVGLETDLGKGLLLVAFLSAGVTCLVLFWIGRLFDPQVKPRTTASRTTEIVIYGMVLVFVAVIAFFYWAAERAPGEGPRVWQVVLTRQSAASMQEVKHCLTPDGNRRRSWKNLDATGRTAQSYDFGRGVETVVTERDSYRAISFATRHAHALTPAELSSAEQCVQGASPAG